MKTLSDFKASLNSDQPGTGLSVQLKSLWYDGKGDWHKAHAQVDQLTDQASAWVHAYLHRKKATFGMPITGTTKHGKPAQTWLWKKSGSSWYYSFLVEAIST